MQCAGEPNMIYIKNVSPKTVLYTLEMADYTGAVCKKQGICMKDSIIQISNDIGIAWWEITIKERLNVKMLKIRNKQTFGFGNMGIYVLNKSKRHKKFFMKKFG